MRASSWIRAAGFGLLAAFLCRGEAPAAAPPPVEAYAQLPMIDNPRLSPDGNSVAMIAPVAGRPALIVYHLDGKEPPTVLTVEGWTPDWFYWKSDHRLIASIRTIAPQAALGHFMPVTRLLAVDSDGKNPKNIVHAKPGQNWTSQLQDRLVDILPNDPDHILIEVDRNQQSVPDVVKVNVETGEAADLVVGRGNINNWMADRSGAVRLGVGLGNHPGSGTEQSIYVRDTVNSDWRVIDKADVNRGTPMRPIAFSANANILYAEIAPPGGTFGVYEFDIAKGVFGQRVIDNKNRDAALEMHDGVLIGYNGPAAPGSPVARKMVYLDAAWEHDIESIDRAVPDTFNVILDRSADGKRVLIFSRSPKEAGVYSILDRRGPKTTLDPLGSRYPKIDDSQVATVRSVAYKARDGLTIQAWLTLPPAVTKRPLPFVILPHGGPSAQDTGAFDWLAQFIASRGYGVLQPNFRGSTGFGPAFEQAGFQQWGLAMQDDVTDGTKWLVQQKLADPNKICIAGASYGGYAALMGVVKEPDLYRCAISISGVSDLERLVDNLRYFKFRDANAPRISNGHLSDTSPADHADRVRAPVLLFHGKKDFTVPPDQTAYMESALKHAGKPVEAVYFDDDDHFYFIESDRIAMLKSIERFLNANLGPGATN